MRAEPGRLPEAFDLFLKSCRVLDRGTVREAMREAVRRGIFCVRRLSDDRRDQTVIGLTRRRSHRFRFATLQPTGKELTRLGDLEPLL
jgi:hypothetical protein